jgi:putative nucleotidyltransferase with HDIG domain
MADRPIAHQEIQACPTSVDPDGMSGITGTTGSSAPSAEQSSARESLVRVREEHLSRMSLWDRLAAQDPASARQVYLEKQLLVANRLSSTMAAAVDPVEAAQRVADELHTTFGIYLAVVQQLGEDGRLRVVAAAGPLAEAIEDFLLREQSIDSGVNGRVARTAKTVLVRDTRLDPDYLVRDLATDPLSELSVPIVVEGRVWGVLNLEEAHTNAFDEGDATLLELVATELGSTLHRCRLYQELEQAFTTTLRVLCAAAEANDGYTAAHEEGVAELAVGVASQMGLSTGEQQTVRYAALTHDIGKLAVPSEILNKPGPLDPDEWTVMKRHSIVGAELLRQIPYFSDVHPIVRSHHERWDGNGYPDGLQGAEIPLGARILTACDSYSAMVTDRPYRRAMSRSAAEAELMGNAGSQFDGDVVDALRRHLADAVA